MQYFVNFLCRLFSLLVFVDSQQTKHYSTNLNTKLSINFLNCLLNFKYKLLLIRQCLKFAEMLDFLLLVWREMLGNDTIAYISV